MDFNYLINGYLKYVLLIIVIDISIYKFHASITFLKITGPKKKKQFSFYSSCLSLHWIIINFGLSIFRPVLEVLMCTLICTINCTLCNYLFLLNKIVFLPPI